MSKLLLDSLEEAKEAWLESPYEFIAIHVPLALKIGCNPAMIFSTMAGLSIKHTLTNRLIKERFAGLFNGRTVNKCLNELEKLEVIEPYFLSVTEIAEILISKSLKGKGIGTLVCDWCSCNTCTLHAHHYPVPKKENGGKTVNICANCHREYHYLAGLAGRPELYHYEINLEKAKELIGVAHKDYEKRFGFKYVPGIRTQ